MTPAEQAQLKEASRLLETDQLAAALKKLAALYEDRGEPAPAVNYYFARALAADRQYERARQVAREEEAYFYQSPDRLRFLVDLDLATENFLAARQLVASQPAAADQAARVMAAEEDFAARAPQTIQTRLQHFYHLGDQSFFGQQRRFAEAQRLPLAQFVQGSRFVLRDPFVHPLIKSSLVQVLSRLGVDDAFQLLWLDGQEHPVVPAALLELEQLPVVQEIYRQLADRFANDDPQTYQLRQQEFNLQLTLLYPLVDQAITDPQAWVVALCQPIESGEGPAVAAARKWQARLQAQLASLAR